MLPWPGDGSGVDEGGGSGDWRPELLWEAGWAGLPGKLEVEDEGQQGLTGDFWCLSWMKAAFSE